MSEEIKSYCNPELGNLPTKYTPPEKGIFDLFSLKGKVASITGSSGGIGWALAEGYAQSGADVAIWYNSTPADDKAKYLEEKYGIKAKAYKADISNAEIVKNVINEIKKDFGKIDTFVANAGIIWDSGFLIDEQDLNKWNKLIDINVNAVFYCAHAIGQIFKEQGFGNLIITSSMSGSIVNIPQPLAAYNTSKAAVKHLAKSLAVEWAPFARVNSVSPGYIATNMVEYADKELVGKWCQLTPLGRLGNPTELIAGYIYLSSDAASFTTGCDLNIDGGYSIV
ncbi:SOU2 [Candida pseudojiufengensis]|uniref:SOU2 n=1 Tax=Candida pseudojiufengensis TaxID=497109 RepID=UPI00222554E5|nr:SOU2 [Candida pseudojiufengensis]KAI5965726.1 SOU2 [Candida pseudojiufengensis]